MKLLPHATVEAVGAVLGSIGERLRAAFQSLRRRISRAMEGMVQVKEAAGKQDLHPGY